MKQKIKRHSRSILSVLLSVCMLISCMTVGLIATDAAKVADSSEAVGAKVDGDPVGYSNLAGRVYFDNSLTNWSNVYLYVGHNKNNGYGKSYTMTNTGYHNIWYVDISDNFTDRAKLFFANHNDSPNGQNYSIDTQYGWNTNDSTRTALTTASDNDAGSLFTPASNSAGSLTRTYPRVVAGTIASNGWDDCTDIMSVSSTPSKTYENVAAGNYSLAVVGFYNNWSPAYRWSAKGTLTPNGIASWADAGDGDHNIKLTTTSTANITITLNSSNKVDITVTAVASNSNYSITGDIDSSCVTTINGSANTITRGAGVDDATWWGQYHAGAAVSSSTGTTGVYTIDITTVNRENLPAGFTAIDIGLYKKDVGQKAFKVGNTYYNYIGGDYKVTSAGLTDADIVDLAASNGGGSLILQPGRSYRITINENTNKISVSCTSGDKYFLAGQYSDGTTQFFGGQWNTANNELTLDSGTTYTKTFSTANSDSIAAGTINFKVIKNGDSDGWDGGAYPANGNQTYVIKANPTSVTFTFDSSNNTTTVTQTNSGGGQTSVTGWMYSGTAAANRTEVDPTSGMSTFDASTEGNDQNGKFRFMYGTTDTGLTSIKVPEKYKSTDPSNAYWAEITDNITHGSNFFFGLTNYWNKGNLVGNKSEEINDSSSNKEIKDVNNQTLFKLELKQNDNVSGSAKYVLIYGIDWTKVSAIGVKAYDNSKSTNSNNTHNGKVDYQFYYKAKVAEPVTEAKTVDIVAKNGTLRDSTFNRFTNLADTNIENYFYYSEIVNGTLTEYNSISAYNTAHSSKQIVVTHNVDYGNSTYDTMTNVPVGAKIKISTELSPNSEKFRGDEKFSDTHYLKAYSFNGMTYKVFKPADGVATTNGKKYTEEWTVRAVNTTYHDANDVLQFATLNGNTVEVTPIYYMQDNSNCKTFYIDGYDGEVQNAWGNMLAVYPYYENISGKANAFGGYPGQPMLLWGGKYQMEIPLTVDGTATGASVKGLTLHNGYWDLKHRELDSRCNSRNHAQTYDYDDFYKLYKEKNPDTIIFDFKYRTAEDNYGDGYDYTRYTFADNTTKQASNYTGNGHNGVEIVTDYFGRQVDAFGNLIADANKSHYGEDNNGTPIGQTNELLFVSTGYKDTYVGEYATLWAVYAPNGSFIGYISSSMLYLNNIDRRLQYTDGDSTASGRMSWSSFVNTYNTLKSSYTGVPALIVYEEEIWNDSKDKANRSDGKWYYSNKSDKVEASIKIQYGSYTLLNAPDHSVSSSAWIDDPFDQSQTGVGGEKNIGTNTGCSAYFTNTTPNLLGHVESGEQFADSTKSFTFEAVAGGSYMFAGWVRYSNGKYYEISESEVGESPMSANDVYIARFVDAQTGSLSIQHVVEQTDTFNGTGTPSITVTVKNGGTNVTGSPYTVSDGSKIDISKWIDSHFASYTIDISLTTTPSNESFMKEIVSSSGNFAPATHEWNSSYTSTNSSGASTSAKTTTVAQFTVQQILDSGVTSLRYVSHLMKPLYTYNYEIIYTYNSRFWGAQSYTQTGTCDDGDFTGSKTSATLTTDFIISKTPYEKNFRQQINWNYTASAVGDANAMTNTAATDQGSNTYKMTAHVYSSNTVNDRVTAEFILPYYYNGKDQDYSAHVADVYNSASDAHDSYQSQSYLYDTSHESVTLDTQAYKLFTTDDKDHGGSDDTLASSLHLIEAAPYLMMDGDGHSLEYHYMLTDNLRYYTGKSFKVGNTTYYLSQADVPDNPGTYKVLTANDSVTFTKIKYAGTDHTTTYHFAVEDTSGGQKGQYGYKIYFFSYVTDDFGNYVDNEGHSVNSPIFNGQYCVYSVGREKDGIIAETGVKKYFTRWDIYNTKGEFVASCYNRRFNYSGYDNYVVRPIYESDTEQNYASSSGIDNRTLANITYLGDTRNQWNGGALGNYATVTGKTDGNTAGDKLIHDFALAYAYNGQELSKVPSSTPIRVGMIIEQLDVLDSAGGTKIVDSSYYAEKYNKSSNAHRPEVDMPKIKTWLEGNAGAGVKLSTYVGHTCINSKIGNNVDNNWGQKFGSTPAANSPTNKMSFDSVIDNFNRLQWFYTFTNTKTGEGGTIGATNNANFAYRAWAYIIVDGEATVSSTPTYFTLYDSASR